MLSEKELLQICRRYELVCPICETKNSYFRLKRDMARPLETEGDGHPHSYKWGKAGFDSVDPLQFFWGTCMKCFFTGEMGDQEFRQAERQASKFRTALQGDGLRQFLTAMPTGKGIAQSLGLRLNDEDILIQAVAKFHLGIYSQCLRNNFLPGNIARYYLRIAWLYRDQERFYPDSDLGSVDAKFEKLHQRWKSDLPQHADYPELPGLALNEVDALKYSLTFFERNYETLKEAKHQDELRLILLLGEIGFRLFELTADSADFKKAGSFFSGAMQKCMNIINDKSIVGGAVNRAKEMLEVAGERGRDLRGLHKEKRVDLKKKKAQADKRPNDSGKDKTLPQKIKKKAGSQVAKGSTSTGQTMPPANGNDSGQAANGNDSGQATRQLNIMKEELETLKGRLKELESDNKKWRQMAGRDAMTGLPNKVMLFTMSLPKKLPKLRSTGPFSCIGISFDQVAQINKGYGWEVGDHMLKQSVRNLRHFLVEGEDLYRLDGTHFAIVGEMDNNMARRRASDMRRQLSRSSVEAASTQLPLVSSIGVVTVEQIVGQSTLEASKKIFDALLNAVYKAKQKGGNTVEFYHSTKF